MMLLATRVTMRYPEDVKEGDLCIPMAVIKYVHVRHQGLPHHEAAAGSIP
jgi:hypothetical protein